MKEFVRRIDDLGRIVIPKEMRRGLGITEGDPMNIEAVPGGVLVSPVNASCVICGSTKDLLTIDGVGVCRNCAEHLKTKLEELQNEEC